MAEYWSPDGKYRYTIREVKQPAQLSPAAKARIKEKIKQYYRRNPNAQDAGIIAHKYDVSVGWVHDLRREVRLEISQ